MATFQRLWSAPGPVRPQPRRPSTGSAPRPAPSFPGPQVSRPPAPPPLPAPADQLRVRFERRASVMEQRLGQLPPQAEARRAGLAEQIELLREAADELARTQTLSTELRNRIASTCPNMLAPGGDAFEGPKRKPPVNLGNP